MALSENPDNPLSARRETFSLLYVDNQRIAVSNDHAPRAIELCKG